MGVDRGRKRKIFLSLVLSCCVVFCLTDFAYSGGSGGSGGTGEHFPSGDTALGGMGGDGNNGTNQPTAGTSGSGGVSGYNGSGGARGLNKTIVSPVTVASIGNHGGDTIDYINQDMSLTACSGGGGGGGAHIFSGSSLTVGASLTGGRGGDSGHAVAWIFDGWADVWFFGFSGGGGGGGDGLVMIGSAPVTLTANANITGGRGGNSGDAGGSYKQEHSRTGQGGSAGAGVVLNHLGTVNNHHQIKGGRGGNSGSGRANRSGAGGDAIVLRSGGEFNNHTSALVEGGGGGSIYGSSVSVAGGLGGRGVYLGDVGTVTQTGASIYGGAGGDGNSTGSFGGGSGIFLSAGGTVENNDNSSIYGGEGGERSTGGEGIIIHNNGTIWNRDSSLIQGGIGGLGYRGGGGKAVVLNLGDIHNQGGSHIRGGAGRGAGHGATAIELNDGGNIYNTSASISGGDGGSGSGTGPGGDGGIGIQISSGDIYNDVGGIIEGGVGGVSNHPTSPTHGSGGIGIVATDNMTVSNYGIIQGGLGGDGTTRADAIAFQSDSNTLQLYGGYSILGNVVCTTPGTHRLFLMGDTDDTFNVSLLGPLRQYDGFTNFEKTGTSVWTLTNTTADETPWILRDGTLVISDNGALGANSQPFTFDGGTLRTNAVISSSRTFVLTSNGTIDTNGYNSTFSGTISGNAVLTKSGSGDLILTGSKTGTGNTVISAGSLRVGSGGTSGSVAGDIINNSSLVFNRSDAVTYNRSISGTGSVTKSGSNVLTLSGANTYTGTTHVNSGTLRMGVAHTLPGLTQLNLANIASAVFDLAGRNQSIGSLAGGGTTGGNVTLGAANLTIGSDDTAVTYSGVITGTGDLIKTGTGTQTFAGIGSSVRAVTTNSGELVFTQDGDFTMTGAYTNNAITSIGERSSLVVGSFLQGGSSTLNISIGAPLPIKAGHTTLAGTLNVEGLNVGPVPRVASDVLNLGGKVVIESDQDIVGDFTTVNGGGGGGSGVDYIALHLGTVSDPKKYQVGYGLTWLLGNSQANGLFTLTNASDVFDIDIALSNQVQMGPWDGQTLTKAGDGILFLSDANDYTGNTNITGGRLQMGAVNALPGTTTVNFADTAGAILELDKYDQTISSLSGGGGMGGNVNLGGSTLTLHNNEVPATYDGLITGLSSSTLVKDGAATQIFSRAGSSVGNVTTSDGALAFAQDGSFTVTDTYTNNATTVIGEDAFLITDNFVQGSDGVLEVTLGNKTPIITNNATLDGILDITGFSAGLLPERSSKLLNDGVTIIQSENNFIGDFAQITGLGSSGVDYAVLARVTDDPKKYQIGYNLKWMLGTADADGVFTLDNPDDEFALDTILQDQTVPVGAAWDGRSLRKVGPGRLTFFAANLYTGGTSLEEGVLRMGHPYALPYGKAVTLLDQPGSVLDLNNHSQTIGSLSGGGTTGGHIDLGTASLSVGGDDSSSTYAGIISGVGGSLIKTGTGELSLVGDNTYSGGTVINGGTLQIGDGGNSGSIVGNITNNNSQVAFNRQDDVSYAGDIIGSGSLIKLGSNVLTLTGANTYTGGTDINTGTLQIGDGGIHGRISGDVEISTGATLRFNRSDAISYSGVLSGEGSLIQSGGDRLTLSQGGSSVGAVTVSTGEISLIQPGTFTTTGIYTNSATTRISKDSSLVTGSFIQGTGGTLNITVGAVVPMTTNNATLNGTLELTNLDTGVVPNTASALLNHRKVLIESTDPIIGNFSIIHGLPAVPSMNYIALTAGTDSDSTKYQAGYILRWMLGTNQANGLFNLTNAAEVFNVDVPLSNQAALGAWDGSSLTKDGHGTLVLSAANTYTGESIIDQGTLRTDSTNALPNLTCVRLADTAGATLNLNGFSQSVGSLEGGGTVGGHVSLGNANLTIGNDNNAALYNGMLTGAGSVTKVGNGTQTFSGQGSFVGSATVGSGELSFTQDGAFTVTGLYTNNATTRLSSDAGLTVSTFAQGNTGTLKVSLGALTPITANNVNLDGNLEISGVVSPPPPAKASELADGAKVLIQSANNISGTFTSVTGLPPAGSIDYVVPNSGVSSDQKRYQLGYTLRWLLGNDQANGVFTLPNTDDAFEIDVVLGNQSPAIDTGWDGRSLIKAGQGTLTLSAENTYIGETRINQGTLRMGVAHALPDTTRVNLANTPGVVLNLNNHDQSVGSLIGGGSSGGNINLSGATLTIGNDNSAAGYDGLLTGAGGALVKMGNGTQTLSRAGSGLESVMVSEGELSFTQNGIFSTTGAYINHSETTLGENSSLEVGKFSQGLGGTLRITVGTSTPVTAIETHLAGALEISGFTAALPERSSQLANSGKTLIQSTMDIVGSFGTVTGVVGGVGVDFVTLNAGVNSDPKRYQVGYVLRWLLDNDQANGVFTLPNTGDTFELDTALADRSPAADTGWNGRTLTKSGDGTLILTEDNTYTGGTTILAGTLQVGNGLALGSIAGDITNSGELVFNRSGSLTYSDIISGNGTMVKTGPGTLILTGQNNYIGATRIDAGTLRVGAENSLPISTAVTLADTEGAVLDLNASHQTIASLSGGGSLGGNVILGNATLTVGDNNDTTYSGIISGAGSLTKQSNGTLTLTGANIYTGGTMVTAGTLQVGNGGTSGSLTGHITNNASLRFNRSDSVIYNGEISGTGSMTKLGGGTLILTGNNIYSGGTTITAGALQIGAGATTGSITGDIANDTTLVFNRAGIVSYNGAISGTGSVIKQGSGTLVLSGTSSYSGGTTINDGVLQVEVADALPTGTAVTLADANGVLFRLTNFDQTIASLDGGGPLGGNVDLGNATLTVGSDNDSTYGGVISGDGSLTKVGSGALILTGKSTYTGATNISTGTLQMGTENALPPLTAVTLAGAALDLNNNDQTIGSLAGVGNVALGSAVLTVDNTNDATYDGVMTGTTGSLAKKGSGTLTLSSIGSSVGAVTVDTGALAFTQDGTFTTTGDYTNRATTTLSADSSLVIDGEFTQVNGSTLNIAAGDTAAIRATNITIGNTDTVLNITGFSLPVSLTKASELADTLVDLLNSTTPIDGDFTTVNQTTSATVDYLTLYAGRSIDNQKYQAGVSLTWDLDTTKALGSFTLGDGESFEVNTPLDDRTLPFDNWDGKTLTKKGEGTLILSEENRYSGGTVIEDGVLRIFADNNLGAAEAGLTLGATNTKGTLQIIAPLNMNRAIQTVGNAGGVVDVTGHAVTLSGNIAGSHLKLQGTNTGVVTLTGDNSGLAGALTVDTVAVHFDDAAQLGVGTRILQGGGKLRLLSTAGHPVTFSTLAIGVGGGVLEDDSTHDITLLNLNTVTNPFTVNSTSTGKVILTGTQIGNGTITVDGGTFQVGSGADTGSVSGDVVLSNVGTQLVFNRSNAITYNGAISGDGSLSQEGNGVLTLSGTNAYMGDTQLNSGTISVSNDNNIGMGTLVFNGGALQVTGTTFNGTAQNITWGVDGGTFAIADAGNTFTVAQDFGGSVGVINKRGDGILLLSGNRNAAGAVSIQEGTIKVDDDGSLGSGDVSMANGTKLAFDQDVTLANNLSLTGTVTLDNEGHVGMLIGNITGGDQLNVVDSTLTANSKVTVTGAIPTPVRISQTQLEIGDGGALNGNADLADENAGLIFNRSDNFTYNHVISGNGNFIQAGSNAVTLMRVNTLAGTTTVKNGSTLIIGAGGALDSNRITLEANSTFDIGLQNGAAFLGNIDAAAHSNLFVGDKSITLLGGAFAGNILDGGANSSSGGRIIKEGATTLILTGNNTYSGGTRLNSGTIEIDNQNALGTGTMAMRQATTLRTINTIPAGIANSITLEGDANFDTLGHHSTLSGMITGSGGITFKGGGEVTLSSADNVYSGATIIDNTKLIADGDNVLSANSRISLNNTVSAELELQGNQTIAGLAGGGASGGSILLGTHNLTVNTADNSVYEGVIFGDGSLIKRGTGLLELKDRTHPYTGPTTIQSGELKVNGELSNSVVTVGTGARFSGNATVFELFNQGSIKPGNSIGTIRVYDNYTNTGSYLCEVNDQGESDYIQVTGTANLGGQVRPIVIPGNYQRGAKYTYHILSAPNINGTFHEGIHNDYPKLYKFVLDHQASNVYLEMEKASSLSDQVPDGNGHEIADELEDIPNPGGSLAEVIDELSKLEGEDLIDALSQLDAAENMMLQSVRAGQSFDRLGVVLSALNHTHFECPVDEATHDLITGVHVPVKNTLTSLMARKNSGSYLNKHFNLLPETQALPQNFRSKFGKLILWGSGSGRLSEQDTFRAPGTIISGVSANTAGMQLGADYKIDEDLLVGVMGGYAHTRYHFTHHGGHGSLKNHQFGLYGSWRPTRKWYVDGALSFGHNHFEGKRIISFGKLYYEADQSHSGYQVGGLIESGYDMGWACDLTITPIVGLGLMHQRELPYTEYGAGTVGLKVAAQDNTFYQTKVGIQISKLLTKGDKTFYGYVKLAYTHRDVIEKQKVTSRFIGGGNGFTVSGPNQPLHFLSPSFGLTTILFDDLSLSFGYNGNFAYNERSHQAFIKLSKKF